MTANDADARDGSEATWVALVHSPGPDVSGSVFGDARFADHLAFLGQMKDAGYLVAAGPLEDALGEGMTILRLPGAGHFDEARALAEADLSVVNGLFTVRVRPWQVVLEGS